MRLRKRTVWRALALLALGMLAAALIAPHLTVNRFARRVRESLEVALGRKVDLGEVSLSLFPSPGFSVSRVVIHEDPRISLEPLAYLESLEARLSFRSLWAGRLEFSTLRLNQPSVNLTKPPLGEWNFEPLLTRTVGAATQPEPRFPDLQVRGGRINFKFGEVKSVFYLTEPVVDVSPPGAPGGEWRIRFAGEPARTDRPARGMGRFSGRGRWRPDPRTGGQLELTLELENSPLGELTSLVHGYDLGVHGRASSSATLSGPASALQIRGRLQLQDIHRWDLLPPHSEGWRLDYRGRLDLAGQVLELETFSPVEPAAPVALRVRVREYLAQPRWGILATFQKLRLAPLVEVARHMGVALPSTLAAEGDLNGVIGYSPAGGLQGRLACTEAGVTIAGTADFRLRRAEVTLDGDLVRMPPATLLTADNQQATLQVEYSRSEKTLQGSLHGGPMPIAQLRAGAAALLGPVPLLEHSSEGSWEGRLSYCGRPGQPPAWSGAFEITQAHVGLPGLAEPLEIQSARGTLREGGATVDRMRARVGHVEFRGQYRYAPKAARPHQVQLSIPQLDSGELERILMPTLQRSEGLLARTLRLGRTPTPPWLAERHAEASVEVGGLKLGGLFAEDLRTRMRWDGTNVELDDLEVRLGEGVLRGKLSADLSRAAPAYRFTGQLDSVAFSAGRWEAEGSLQTQGVGAGLWRNLRAQARFRGRRVIVGPEVEAESLSGKLELMIARGLPRLRLADLEVHLDEDVLYGQGATQEDGQIHLDLADGRHPVRVTVTLIPFQFSWRRSANRD